MCQVLKLAYLNEKSIGILNEDIYGCPQGGYVLGLCKLPEDTFEGYTRISREIFDSLVEKAHKLPLGKYEAVLFAPLKNFKKNKFDPDIIFLAINPAQVHKLLEGYFEATGEKPSSDLNGHWACEVVAAAINNNKPWVNIPCAGARAKAWAQDDELWFAMPPDQFNKTMELIKKNETRYPTPIKEVIVKDDYRDEEFKVTKIDKLL
jgi:uncharacterized protein (DUF169 family)